jgi:intracellular protein transport protein USO1
MESKTGGDEKAQAEITSLKSQLEESETKAKGVQSELDDLLLVLGEMEEKHSRYKEKIKSLGGEVSDEEEEEE